MSQERREREGRERWEKEEWTRRKLEQWREDLR